MECSICCDEIPLNRFKINSHQLFYCYSCIKQYLQSLVDGKYVG